MIDSFEENDKNVLIRVIDSKQTMKKVLNFIFKKTPLNSVF